MGYYASGSGDIVLKIGTRREDIEKAIGNLRDPYFAEYDIVIPENCSEDNQPYVWVSSDGKYYEEEVLDFLYALKPYIKNGCVSFNGEDDSHWRFVYKGQEEGWEEQCGRIIYNLDELPNKDLLAEIKKRGLTSPM